MEDKPEEKGFKISDKRRFTSEGEEREEGGSQQEKHAHADTGSEPDFELKPGKGEEVPHEITFSSFVVSLGTQALMQLGEIPPPPGIRIETDKMAARQSIDILLMLREKTKGNLEQSEEDLLEEVLHSAQISFVRQATRK